MGYRYGDIEQALVKQFQVRADRLGAFRARVRHFRSLGVPRIDRVGSGSKVEYTRLNAVELCVALHLAAAGIAPRVATGIVVAPWLKDAIKVIDKTGSRVFVVHTASNTFADEGSDSDGRTVFAFGEAALLQNIGAAGEFSSVIDLSRLMGNLDSSLSP
jgi:hypothetical protein